MFLHQRPLSVHFEAVRQQEVQGVGQGGHSVKFTQAQFVCVTSFHASVQVFPKRQCKFVCFWPVGERACRHRCSPTPPTASSEAACGSRPHQETPGPRGGTGQGSWQLHTNRPRIKPGRTDQKDFVLQEGSSSSPCYPGLVERVLCGSGCTREQSMALTGGYGGGKSRWAVVLRLRCLPRPL